MKQFLSPQEREGLKGQHKRERDKRVCDRIKAVLLFDEGWDYKEISHVLLLSDDAIQETIRAYIEQQQSPVERRSKGVNKLIFLHAH